MVDAVSCAFGTETGGAVAVASVFGRGVIGSVADEAEERRRRGRPSRTDGTKFERRKRADWGSIQAETWTGIAN